MKERIKLVLVDDHQVVLKGLESWLNEDDEIDVVGTFNNAKDTLKNLPNLSPHVVVSDVRMPDMNGFELTDQIMTQYHGNIKVVLVSGFYTDEYHYRAMELGVSAFLPKDSSYQQLIHAIKQSYLGNCIVPAHLQRNLKETRLTLKEKEVLKMVAEGRTNDEIAIILNISRRTVEHHLSTIFRKLNVDGRVSAVMEGLRQGVIEEI